VGTRSGISLAFSAVFSDDSGVDQPSQASDDLNGVQPAMYTRPITCGAPGCSELAEYKIAAHWSAGKFSELKTYGLACAEHYTQTYRDALRRRKVHPPSPEEIQGEMGVYHFEKGQSVSQLEKVANPE
jgi:hypothetical protein